MNEELNFEVRVPIAEISKKLNIPFFIKRKKNKNKKPQRKVKKDE